MQWIVIMIRISCTMDVLCQKILHSFGVKVIVANVNCEKQKPHNVWVNM